MKCSSSRRNIDDAHDVTARLKADRSTNLVVFSTYVTCGFQRIDLLSPVRATPSGRTPNRETGQLDGTHSASHLINATDAWLTYGSMS